MRVECKIFSTYMTTEYITPVWSYTFETIGRFLNDSVNDQTCFLFPFFSLSSLKKKKKNWVLHDRSAAFV